MKKRTLFVMLTTLFVLGLFLTACASTPTAEPAKPTTAPVATSAPAATSAPVATAVPAATKPAVPTAAPVATAAVAPAKGSCGTVRLLWWQAATILNPHLASGSKDWDDSPRQRTTRGD